MTIDYDAVLGKKNPDQAEPQDKSAQLQQKMMEVQKKLASLEAEGNAGTEGLSVKVFLNGRYEASKVVIDPELLKQSPEVLCNLVASAITDASHNAERMIQAEMMAAMQGFNMPG